MPIIKRAKANKQFSHHVYFWLNNTGNADDTAELIRGLEKLSTVPTIRTFHIGVPADTYRDVVERGYAVSWLCLFDNPTDQEIYQTHPIHLIFVEECKHLWSKVIVFDSVSV